MIQPSHSVSFWQYRDRRKTLKLDVAFNLKMDEGRYVLLGMRSSLRLFVVSHLYQEDIELIRIISARKATKRERQQYREFFS